MNFSDFTKVGKREYPESIDMAFLSAQEQINMKIRLSGFSTEKVTSFTIKIPEKYEQIRVD